MLKKRVIPECPVCGSNNVSPDLLMQCNCTKGMGRNLCYPKYRCRDCHTAFGNKKNDRSKNTIGVRLQSGEPSIYTYSIKKENNNIKYAVSRKNEIVLEKNLSLRTWKRFIEKLYGLYVLEWPKTPADSNYADEKSRAWKLEIDFDNAKTEVRTGQGVQQPYYMELETLIKSFAEE